MSLTDPRFDSIMATPETFSTTLGQQLDFNQQTDQHIATLMNRFDQFENCFNNPEAIMKKASFTNPQPVSSATPTSQEASDAHHPDPSSKSDAIDPSMAQQPKSNTTRASIASKPPAPLTDHKRQALHRFFNPPANDSTQNGSYSLVFVSRSRRMNRSQIRLTISES